MERLSHRPNPELNGLRSAHAEQLAQLPLLWETVYGDRAGILGLFSGARIARRLQQPREVFFRFPQEMSAALTWVRAETERNRELYQCGHLLVRPRRRKADAAPLAALYADVDEGHLNALSLPPSAVVESSPGRLQAYWRLTVPVAPAVGESLNRRVALAVNADKTGWDLTQLLRLPGTRNHKYDDAPLVRLLTVTDVRYEPAALSAVLPEIPNRPTVRTLQPSAMDRQPGQVTAQPPVRLSPAALAVWRGEDLKATAVGAVDRSASLVRIARVLFEAGLRGDALIEALVERDAALGWQKYTGRRDAQAQYQAIVAVVTRGERTRRRQD